MRIHRVTRRRVLGHLLGAVSILTFGGCKESETTRNRKVTLAKNTRPLTIPPMKLAGLPDGLTASHFVIHNRSPLALESKRKSVPYRVITPSDRLFVRNNLPRPPESILTDRNAWVLEVTGTKREDKLALGQLKAIAPSTTVNMVLQCSGNGRAFFDHGASGSQWATGAAGCVQWTGLKVSELFDHLGGALTYARYLTGTGGESLPKGVARNKVIVERSVPIEKGLKDCILAWEMNGEPIPITHGGPLRLVVPGYFGCNQIKYIKRLAATADQSPAKIQQRGYRFRAIGQSGDPSQPSMWRMPVKSWFISARVDDLKNGKANVKLEGVAFSGERGVASVSYSVDGGQSWLPTSGPESASQVAQFGADAWQRFSIDTTLPVGSYEFASRATDTKGDIQPKDRIENERGYGHNGWFDHALTVMVGESKTDHSKAKNEDSQQVVGSTLSKNEMKDGRQLFAEKAQPACGTCHALADAETVGQVGPSLDTLKPSAARVHRAVKNGVGAMPGYGDRLTEAQIDQISKYVEQVTK